MTQGQATDPLLDLEPAERSLGEAALTSERLEQGLRAAPLAVLPPSLFALVAAAAYLLTPQALVALVLAGLVVLVSLVATALARLGRHRLDAGRDMAHAERIAAVAAFAVASACAWLVVALVLASGADGRQALLAATIGLQAGALLVGPTRGAGLAFVAPLAAGGFAGGCVLGGAVGVASAIVQVATAAVVLVARHRVFHAAARRSLDRVRMDEQGDLIDLLLDLREDCGEWLWETDAVGRLRDVSAPLAAALGAPIVKLAGRPLVATLALVDTSRDARVLADIEAHRPFHRQVVAGTVRGASVWWRLSGKPVFDARGTFLGYRGIGADVTAAREAEARLARMATHDALTGLANRETFLAYAERACADAAAGGRMRALLFLDLDGFKPINDQHGHDAGDGLLAVVASTLLRAAPKGAMVARLGGDEFAILTTPAHPDVAETLAKTIAHLLAQPVRIGEAEVRIGVSIGISHAPRHATQARDLAKRADLALYRAKAAGRGGHVVFREEFERAIEERRLLEADIRLALANDEFELYYQPLLDLAAGSIGACEALIRWNSPTRGFVSPADFIPAAEAGGLITGIGRFVLSRACRDAAGWPLPASVAVNISPDHLRSADFLGDVATALRESGLPPSRLEIEITEGVFLEKSGSALAALDTLRDRGIKIALDDFGTGFSSLNYLIAFPVDKIKIDQSFIKGLADSHKSRAIVDALLMLARRLGLRVVAEGVETSEQALSLKLLRCDDLQGYLISKPRPAGEIGPLLEALPAILRAKVPALLESSFAAALAIKQISA